MPFPVRSWRGTHVPVYSVLRGKVTKRDWTYHDPTWCGICNEPIAAWLTHIGRKDHSLLDTHYDLLVDFPSRRWDAQSVLEETLTRKRLGAAGADVTAYHKALDKTEHARRTELTALIDHLLRLEVLDIGERGGRRQQANHWFGSNLEGHLAIHQFMIPMLTRLFPMCDLPVLSNFEDFISSAYNMETVYDVCGLRTIDPASGGASDGADGANRGSGEGSGGWGDNDTASATSSQPPDTATTTDTEGDTVRFSHKANFVRSVLAQLRWCLLEEEPPSFLSGAARGGHVAVLGRQCALSLIAEMIDARVCEYVVRSEMVWHRHGMERRVLTGDPEADDAGLFASRWDATPRPHVALYKSQALHADELYTLPVEHA
jgi:hypothetical protein